MSLSIKDYTGPKLPQYIEGVLQAGEMRGVDAIGDKFYVVEADGELTIKTNNGSKNQFKPRQGESADDNALYERIEIYNDTADAITYRVFYGFGNFLDGRAEIVGTVEVDSSVLPAGASTAAKQDALFAAVSTAAKQDTGNASLASVDGKLPALAGGKVPVVDAVADASLASIDGKLPALSGGKVPVIQATEQTEDAASAGGEKGQVPLFVRRDDVTDQTTAAGDFSIPTVDRFGATVVRDQQRIKRTYSAAFQIVPAANPTDVVEILGAANRLVEITKIIIGGVQTTAGQMLVDLIKRSAANTTGTSTNATKVPHDATDAAASATIKKYTVNPGGLGAAVGSVRSARLPIGKATDLIAPSEINFAERGKPVTLNAATESLCLNLGGVTLTGGTLDVSIEWTETTV